MTTRTSLRRRAWLGARAMASRAFLHRRNANLGFGAACRFFERQLEVVTQIGATINAVATSSGACGAAAKNFAEDIAKRIGKATEAFGSSEAAGTGTKARGRIHAGMTELVISRAFLGVSQDLVRLFCFLEFFFGSLVVRIAVRMMFHREFPIRLLDVFFGSVAIDAQYRVIVAFGHSSLSISLRSRRR